MVIGLVNTGVMTLMQATPIIIDANIGTTITGVLVALKNDYFNMANIRKKFGAKPGELSYINNELGVGYRMD